MSTPFPTMGKTSFTDLPIGLQQAIHEAHKRESALISYDVTDVVAKGEEVAQEADKSPQSVFNPPPGIQDPSAIINEAVASPAEDPVTPQRDKLTIQIGSISAIAPPNHVLIGTSKPEVNYTKWLEKRMTECISDTNTTRPAATRQKAGQFMYACCYIAMAEDLTKKLDYTWVGPRPKRKIDIEGTLRSFIVSNKSTLKLMAPFYGVTKDKILGDPA
jgi:hypothetical protein